MKRTRADLSHQTLKLEQGTLARQEHVQQLPVVHQLVKELQRGPAIGRGSGCKSELVEIEMCINDKTRNSLVSMV